MISSTIRDMRAERDAIDSLITSQNFVVLRSETHDAIGISSRGICERMARDCHLYIGIFGNVYGTIIEGDDISVTEMEFDTARGVDPTKILVYLKAKDPNIDDKRQEAFREKVTHFSTGYFRHRFFNNTDDLTEQVKKDLASWITENIELRKKLNITNLLLSSKVKSYEEQISILVNERGLEV